MEAALVSVSTGVMKPLLSKLTKLLEEEYVKLKGTRKRIKFLRDELSAMNATLEMLADAEQLNPEMREWRDTLRELAYDLEDCVDVFMAGVNHGHDGHSGFKRFFSKLKKLKMRHHITNQIEEIKACVIEASERHKRYNLDHLTNRSSTSAIDPRLPALYEEIDRLVGIDGPKKQIIKLLAMEMNSPLTKLKVVSIVGCGGLGKTTLAKQVHDTIKRQFTCAAFVSVSRNLMSKKILRDIAKGVGVANNTMDDDEQHLIEKLRRHLKNKRYLVVIDDVWDTKPWEIIKLALVNNNCGSRIITTTRSIEVASYLSSRGGNVYQMEYLSFNDSKRLLFKRAFGSENLCCAHLGSVPDEIVRKCDGLPLAIITISSMLADQLAKSEWDRVLNDIGSALAKNPGAENMTTILSMSYFDIPHHLRTCLLYLSVFPEDYVISKHRLINRWIAEGFVHQEGGRTKYEIGEGHFDDLITRSMIQPIYVKYGQAEACRVHDIILDYIKCKAAEENFVTSLDVTEHLYTSKYKVRRLSLTNWNEEHVTLCPSLVQSHLRSVTLFGHPVETSLLAPTVLRVLDLEDCVGAKDHHLAGIEKLFHLKYLRISGSIIKLPEKIGELQNLQTLDIRGTSIKELPSTITKLQLTHLYVDGDTRFPDGMIGQMLSLEELSWYGVQSYEQGKSLQEFSKLTKLRTLRITCNFNLLDGTEGISQLQGIYSYVGTLLSSCNLRNLFISDFGYPLSLGSWNLASPCSLQKLCLKRCPICKVPNWMGSLGNLRVLKLWIICVRPDDVEILGAIPSLLFLKLHTIGGTNGRIMIHSCNGFRSLKYFSLVIHRCATALDFEAGSMPKLEHFKLQFHVHKTECLNGASSLGIQHLSALTKVEIRIYGNCTDDDDYNPKEDEDDGPIRCVARAINTAIKTLANSPYVRFETENDNDCEHFECHLKELSRYYGGALADWFKIWQIEEQSGQSRRRWRD